MQRRLAVLVAALVLAGCTRERADDSWFPLVRGHVWTYRVVTQGEDGSVDRERLTLRTLGNEALPAEGGGRAWRRRSDSGVDYWLQSDATGIYRIASKSDLDAEPALDKPTRFVLKAPLAVGTQWQASTTPYLLMRRNEFPRELRYTHPNVPMTYQIETLDDVVETPAAKFEHCLRVRGTASIRVYADPASGWRDLPLTTLEWYCRGVGLVRVERTEPARSSFLIGGTRTLELESWR